MDHRVLALCLLDATCTSAVCVELRKDIDQQPKCSRNLCEMPLEVCIPGMPSDFCIFNLRQQSSVPC